MISAERRARLELAWWRWLAADPTRQAETDDEDAARCEAWIHGESDDGPPHVDPEDDAACRADYERDCGRDDALAGDEL